MMGDLLGGEMSKFLAEGGDQVLNDTPPLKIYKSNMVVKNLVLEL